MTSNSTQTAGAKSRADFIQVDTALNSMRDSGFDLTAAAGEPIDNSVEAGATIVRVLLEFADKRRKIEHIAFLDNGRGIDPSILAKVLSMGYSTRYGKRGSLGRFGVGLKLAGLSLGTRIDVYSRHHADEAIHHAFIDLEAIKHGEQVEIEAMPVDDWPEQYADEMVDPDGVEFETGTLVIFGDIDRLTSGGTYRTSLDEQVSNLRTFIARAYRKFLDSGLRIELDGKRVTLFDPLFLLDNPRIIDRYKPEDPRGTIIDEDDIEIADGHSIHVTVALVPEEFRPEQGAGGTRDAKGHDIREFHIDAHSAGKISMVRNGREINYDIVPRLLPAGVDKVDRYIGIEVTFPAELDEYFQVRNVKRGAVPVDKLREELRTWLDRPVRAARRIVRSHWNEVETQKRAGSSDHTSATDAAARAEQTTPHGQAGQDLTSDEVEQIVADVLTDLHLTPGGDDEDQIAKIRQQIKSKPITIIDGDWAGKELFEISHLNGKAILKLNHRHPFVRDVYDPLKKVAKEGVDGLDSEDLVALTRKAEIAIDVLFLAYAKAENMHRHPDEQYDELRSYWGQFTHAYLREALKGD
jgi:hypothetical protein